MNKNILLVVTLIGSLFGCTHVIDSRMIPDKPFIAADEYILKSPGWKLKNKNNFDQNFGVYKISNSYQSWTSSKESEVLGSRTYASIPNQLIFGEEEYSNYVQNQSTRFSFHLENNNKKSEILCTIFSWNDFRKTTYHATHGLHETHKGSLSRIKTLLSCKINDEKNETPSIFSIEIAITGEFTTKFTNQLENFTLKANRSFEDTYNDNSKISSDRLPYWQQKIAGFSIDYNLKQIAAISLMNKPRIWIEKIDNHEALFYATAINFSLFMFNDIEGIYWQ
jgi:hypothetical protein